MFAFIRRSFIFRLQRLAMDFGAGPQILLRVREEVVRAGTDNEGAADFGIGDGELGMSRRGTGAHELLYIERRG
jgi:hypothetical protein